MKKNWWYRLLLLLLLTVLGLGAIVPTVFDLEEDTAFPVTSKINLGLDLQGGLYMVLGIDFERALGDEITGYARRIESLLTRDEGIEARIGEIDNADPADPRHGVILDNPADTERARETVRRFFSPSLRLTREESGLLEYALNATAKDDLEKNAVTKSIEVIRNRIDEFGVTEPVIVAQGDDRIVVQLPGVRDIERAKALIGQTAKLEFKLVDDTVTNTGALLGQAHRAGITYERGKTRYSDYLARLNDFLGDKLPEGRLLAFERARINPGQVATAGEDIPFVVESAARLTGEMLQDARVQIDQQRNQPYVSLEFTSEGAEIFEE